MLDIVIGNVLDVVPFIQESLGHLLLANLTQVCDLSFTWIAHIAEVFELDYYSEVIVEDLVTVLHQALGTYLCFAKVKEIVLYEGSVELNSAYVTLAEHFTLLFEFDSIITKEVMSLAILVNWENTLW